MAKQAATTESRSAGTVSTSRQSKRSSTLARPRRDRRDAFGDPREALRGCQCRRPGSPLPQRVCNTS
jgi:hypothetical protein